MSAIGASNVTYTLQGKMAVLENSYKNGMFLIAFGNGVLTYPAGGIPLSGLSSQGFPSNVQSVMLVDGSNADGYLYKYDQVNNKIRIYQAPAQSHNHDILLKNAAVADGATTRVNAGANLLGANTGGDLTVTGGGANGGVVTKTLAAAALAEVSTAFVPAATSLYARVTGF